jgi:histidinol dehydrogenase
LVAADICGTQEIYRVGGAQAIAALAYGTKTIRPVDRIVGPGNKFVTAAKRLVCKDVPIDMPAGPSELVVLADGTANAQHVALDLISQAEHDEDAVVILATNCRELASSVQHHIENEIQNQPRRAIIESALRKNAAILLCSKLDHCISAVDELAPEHVEVVTASSREHARRITKAGMVLVGSYTPVAASDYCLGVNHILPTAGFSSLYSGLSVIDFIRVFSLVECSRDGLEEVASSIRVLARIEGLEGHGLAVKRRFSP